MVLLDVVRGRAVVVEVRYVLSQNVFEVAAVDDQHPVEQFAADGADPSFGDRVRPWRSHWCVQNADALAGEHAGELGIPIPNQEHEARHAIAEIHHEVARLLGNPSAARVRRNAPEVDAAGGVLHDEENV